MLATSQSVPYPKSWKPHAVAGSQGSFIRSQPSAEISRHVGEIFGGEEKILATAQRINTAQSREVNWDGSREFREWWFPSFFMALLETSGIRTQKGHIGQGLVWWKISPPMARGGNEMGFKIPYKSLQNPFKIPSGIQGFCEPAQLVHRAGGKGKDIQRGMVFQPLNHHPEVKRMQGIAMSLLKAKKCL